MKTIKSIIYGLPVVLLLFTGCKKEDAFSSSYPKNEITEFETPAGDEITTTVDLSGFGNRPGIPSVTGFDFPANVTIAKQISPLTTEGASHYGYGQVKKLFTLTNDNDYDVDVTFPERLIFVADNDSSQNVIMAYPVNVSLRAKEAKKIILGMFCLNHDRVNRNTNNFKILGLSNNDQIVRLTELTKTKSDTTIKHKSETLQEIIWDITDRDGLSQGDLDWVRSW